jgi:hypothetical protein
MSKLRTMRAYILFYFFQEVRYKLEKEKPKMNYIWRILEQIHHLDGWMDGWENRWVCVYIP